MNREEIAIACYIIVGIIVSEAIIVALASWLR